MKRAFAALASAAVLVALLPATVGAAAPLNYSDHSVEAFCEGTIDGGYASVGLVTSTQFGDGANADVWLDPAVPFEEPRRRSTGPKARPRSSCQRHSPSTTRTGSS